MSPSVSLFFYVLIGYFGFSGLVNSVVVLSNDQDTVPHFISFVINFSFLIWSVCLLMG